MDTQVVEADTVILFGLLRSFRALDEGVPRRKKINAQVDFP